MAPSRSPRSTSARPAAGSWWAGPGRPAGAARGASVPQRAGPVAGTLHWDILRLYHDVLDGLRAAARTFDLASVGIDSWAVDYGLLDEAGALLGNPVHYRDPAPTAWPSRCWPGSRRPTCTPSPAAAAAVQHDLPAGRGAGHTAAGRGPDLLLMPDLLGYWLTGEVGAELTNASTTQLYDARSGLGHRADRRGGPARPAVPAAAPAREHHRAAAAGDAPGSGRAAAGDRGRLARHRVGGGRGARPGRPLRLHLLRHLVAGRRRARSPGPHRGRPAGQLHQRGRRRRHRPLPAQRDGPVAAAGVLRAWDDAGQPDDLARCSPRPPGAAPGRPSSIRTIRCSCRRGHAGRHRRSRAAATASVPPEPAGVGPVHPRQPRAGLRGGRPPGPGAVRAAGRRRAPRRRRRAERPARAS